MNIRAIVNSILFLSLLAFPLIAEKSTATETNIPGTGFNVLPKHCATHKVGC